MRKIASLAMLLVFAVVFLAGCGAINRTVEEIMTGDYVIGTIDGDNFESEWLNLRFTAPDGFIMASQEEILEMMQLGLDMMDVDSSVVAWAEMAVVSEMMAMLPTGLASVSVATERIMLSNITIEQYVEAAFQGVEALGWEVSPNDDLRQINFAGNQWYTYTATVEAFGIDWSYQYLVRRFDNRMALITVYAIAGEEAHIDTLINAFAAY
ncbi:MAG: hypothetical protein FWC93_04075 [Defluviitaleaceae bacterium]|nr:hypothetical protein [Defluviitaleaceae bacterium]